MDESDEKRPEDGYSLFTSYSFSETCDTRIGNTVLRYKWIWDIIYWIYEKLNVFRNVEF